MRFKTLIAICMLCCARTGLTAQSLCIGAGGNYSIYKPSDAYDFKQRGAGFSAFAQARFKQRFSFKVGLQWQFYIKPDVNATLNGIVYTYQLNQRVAQVKTAAKWWVSKDVFKGLYFGITASWVYLSNTTNFLPETVPSYLYDPKDQKGFSGGLVYGYQYRFNSGFGLYIEGNSDWIRYAVSGDKISAEHQHALGLGLSKTF